MDLAVSSTANASVYNSAYRAAGNSDTDATDMSRKDLVAALNQALPGLTVAVAEPPEDEKEQEKQLRNGSMPNVLIHPDAAKRMQSDASFRDSTIAAIKQDQKDNGAGTVHQSQGMKVETLAHSTVIDKDGNVTGCTFSKATSSNDSDSAGKSKSTGLVDKLKSKLKQQMDSGKLSNQRYQAAVQQAEAMSAQGKSEEEIAATLREALLPSLGPGDDPSVGIEKTV